MLKQSLTANALFSGGSGVGILLVQNWLGGHIPGPDWMWWVLGIGLLAFAAQLALMSVKPGLAQKLAMQVVVSDVAWVVLTLGALLLFFEEVSRTGAQLIVTINVVVATLAVLQYRGLRQLD